MYNINVRRVIGIMSCKGGVGKTTTAINLAVFLKKIVGGNIGVFDADINGPNHSKMLGFNNNISDHYKIKDVNIDLEPKVCHGILSMSMGYFLRQSDPILLRGPMISRLMSYLLQNTKWGKLDYLIIDFPPGTGDIYLTALKNVKFFGVYVITSSQTISIQDTERSLSMLSKFNVTILGVLENMKYYICANCKCKENFFLFNNGMNNLVKKFNIANIFELPFSKIFVESCELGIPLALMNIDNSIIDVYSKMVNQISIIS